MMLPNGQTVPGPWSTIEEVKRHHRTREVDWFDASGFFRTRIESGMLGGRLFLTSEQFVPSAGDPHPRMFTVRCVSDAGDISTLGPFNEMTEREAQQMVRDLLRDGSTVQVRLPARFYEDHVARDLPSGVVVKRLAREVDVRLDREALDDLRSDAEHYATEPSYRTYDPGLVSSAKATLRRLVGVEIPEASE